MVRESDCPKGSTFVKNLTILRICCLDSHQNFFYTTIKQLFGRPLAVSTSLYKDFRISQKFVFPVFEFFNPHCSSSLQYEAYSSCSCSSFKASWMSFFVLKGLFLMFTIYMKIVKIRRNNPMARFIVKYKMVQNASKPTGKYQEEAVCNKVKVKELTKNKRKEGQYAKPKAKEKRPLVDTTKSHSDIGDHRTNRRVTPTLI